MEVSYFAAEEPIEGVFSIGLKWSCGDGAIVMARNLLAV